MTSEAFTRRSVLRATAVATAAAATVGTESIANATAAGLGDPRMSTESVNTTAPLETLSAPAIGEEVRFYAASSMNPNGTGTGASIMFSGNGARPVNAAGGQFNYASISVDLPLGSTLTSIEFIIQGSPQAGRVALIRYSALDSAPSFTYLYQQTIPGAVTGITVYASGPLTEVVDGTHTYEAFYTDNGTALSTSVCNGVRVRYRPPSNGLVPITPARVYDSRLPMTPDLFGPISGGTFRTVSIANARNLSTGAIVGTLVPANATAIAFTLTVVGTTGQGFLAVNPGGVTTVSASSINWFGAGQILANTGAVKVSTDRTVTVAAGGGSTDFIIDIVGYYT
jgi:hypothetical protein